MYFLLIDFSTATRPFACSHRYPPAAREKWLEALEARWCAAGKYFICTTVGRRLMASPRFVPESTQIYVPPYSLHRDSRYFPHAPNQFIPERWLNEHEKQNSAAFIPFSFGPANCVGRLLARREMLMFASAVLHKHRLALAAGFNREAWPSTLHDHFVSTRGPLMVVLTSRDHSRS